MELAEGLPRLIQYLNGFISTYEIIVVDDGSYDAGTIQQVCELYKCIYVGLPENRGKGYAIRWAVSKSSGNLILFMDGDFPFTLSPIQEMIEVLWKKEADITIGDRTLPGSIIEDDLSFSRKLASKVLSLLLKSFSITNFRDTQCGLKGFTSAVKESVFPVLKEDRFGFDIELIYQAQKKAFNIISVPVKVIDQKSSSVKVLKDGWNIFKLTVRLFLHNSTSK